MLWFRRLHIRSKLTLMLLAVSGAVMVVTAAVGYVNGRDGIEARVYDQLTSLRVAKANQVTQYVEALRRHVETMSQTPLVLQAAQELSAGYDAVPAPSPAADSALAAYYQRSFLPRLVTEGEPVLGAFVPDAPQARTLQYLYLAANPEPVGQKGDLADAGDGSAYSAAHARFHPALRRLAAQFDSYDLFLVDPRGRVVYSMAKETDFATSLTDGPYASSNLADLVADVRGQQGAGYVGVADYAFYTPSYGAPAGFLASPLFDGPRFVGVVALQLPAQEISEIMTDGERWAEGGLGQTGETYLVGRDLTMRSNSRLFVEDTTAYAQALDAQGTDSETVRRIRLYDTTVLLQPVGSDAVERALGGESGTERIASDYLGRAALSSAAPLPLGGLDWAVAAEISLDEANAPVVRFQRRVLATAVILSVLVTLLALWLATRFLRPIRTLTTGAREIARGNYDASLETGARDEFGEMGDAFAGLVAALREQVATAETERDTTETTLLRYLPDPLHGRYHQSGGDGALHGPPEEIPNVSLALVRLDSPETDMSTDDARTLVATLDELVGAIDEARLKFGVEKVRTVGNSYFAACGLTAPHLDHTRRALDFAVEVRAIVRRYTRDRGAALRASVAVASGPVVAGVIGKDTLTYGLWGGTVAEARALLRACPPDAVVVGRETHERLREALDFEPLADGWRLVPKAARAEPAAS